MNTMDSVFWRFIRTRRTFPFLFLLCVFLVSVSMGARPASAGFGITPPYVRSDRLTRGTEYQQTINLVRSDPEEDLKVDVTINIPGVDGWFTIDKGNEFVIPKGVMQMPIVVTVHVPAGADYNDYKGTIRIRTSAANPQSGGGVSIALGAQIDVDIKVVDKIFDFNVRQIRVADLEEGILKWGLFFPGKIRFFMIIENTGNTTFGPSRVHFDIYDSNGENLLESVDNTNHVEQIAPFATKEVLAELPTRLPAGSYTVKYTIYKNSDVAQQGQITLSIAALGSVPGYEGYGFDGLSLTDKLKVAGVLGTPVLLLVLFVTALTVRRRRRRKKLNGYQSR